MIRHPLAMSQFEGQQEAGWTPSLLFRRNGSIMVFRGLAIALQGLVAILVARWLGAEGRGLIAAGSVGPQLVSLALFIGFGVSNVYFISRGDIDVPVALGTSIATVGLVTLVVVPLYIASALFVRSSVLHNLPVPFIVVGSLLIPSALVVRYTSLSRRDCKGSPCSTQSLYSRAPSPCCCACWFL